MSRSAEERRGDVLVILRPKRWRTVDFIVEWFAKRFRAAHWAAVGLNHHGAVTPFWPEDKGPWLERLMATLHVTRHEVAAVGDSRRDASLFRAAGPSFYVGTDSPEGLDGIHHYPDGNVAAVARAILRL